MVLVDGIGAKWCSCTAGRASAVYSLQSTVYSLGSRFYYIVLLVDLVLYRSAQDRIPVSS